NNRSVLEMLENDVTMSSDVEEKDVDLIAIDKPQRRNVRKKTYTINELKQAVEAVREGRMNSKEAGLKFNVPDSTIRHHTNNHYSKIGAGRKTYLSREQEEYLISLIKSLEDFGHKCTNELVMKLCGDYMQLLGVKPIKLSDEEEGKPYVPGRKWLQNFLERWKSDVKWLKPSKIESNRSYGFTEEVRVGWFKNLNSILQKLNIMDSPAQIFNCDETGFKDNTVHIEKFLVKKQTKRIFQEISGEGKSYTTVLTCIAANGLLLPPFVIYNGQKLFESWTLNGPDGASYTVTNNGRITTETFEWWFENMFIPLTSHINRPLLLLMDNHLSHINVKCIELAIQNQIHLISLPPNTTHALQPLDVVVFGLVKTQWKRLISQYFKATNRKNLRKSDFPLLLKKLFDNTLTKRQIVSSFSRAGVWPFDENAMKDKVIRQTASELNKTQIDQKPEQLVSSNPQLLLAVNTSNSFNVPPGMDNYRMQQQVTSTMFSDTTGDTQLLSSYQPHSLSGIESSLGLMPVNESIESISMRYSQNLSNSSNSPVVFHTMASSSVFNDSIPPISTVTDRSSVCTISPVYDYSVPTSVQIPIKRPLSPLSAVDAIVKRHFQEFQQKQQQISQQLEVPKKKQRPSKKRIESRFGENITTSNLLAELKEKEIKKLEKQQIKTKGKKCSTTAAVQTSF
ncbi:unnamed protein product, partial [Didymodactylos carnosus]